jgi:drug/metabolite transporter (DMT)-like permease
MSLQLFFTLLAASIGFVSGIFLCIGGMLLSKKALMNLVIPHMDHNESQARSVTSQSSQYTVGGLLLVISFLLQISAATASPTARFDFLSFFHPVVLVLISVCITGVLAYLGYRNVNRRRIDRVLSALNGNVK